MDTIYEDLENEMKTNPEANLLKTWNKYKDSGIIDKRMRECHMDYDNVDRFKMSEGECKVWENERESLQIYEQNEKDVRNLDDYMEAHVLPDSRAGVEVEWETYD